MDTTYSVLIVDDDVGIHQSIRLCLELEGVRVLGVGTPAGALEILDRSRFDLVFLDLWLGSESGLTILPEILRRQPWIGVIVIAAFASFETAVEAMKLGAVDYLPKPFTPPQVRHAARRVVTATVLSCQISELQDRLDEAEGESFFETKTPTYQTFLQTALRAAASDSVVLLRGESGTGKTVLARWMRLHSNRADRPYVTVHCPMLASDLMSSPLFGHCRGAFTDAISDVVGKVEAAEGGTLFLDEVADLTPDAQTRLLRFLHDRSYERLGEAKERKADVRLIAATNRVLEDEVRAGRFREDLFFRFNVITLNLPSLQERPEDVLPLAQHYLRFYERRQRRHHLGFSSRCEEAISNYDWPGNMRELRNAVERAVILTPSSMIESRDLGLPFSEALLHSQPNVDWTTDTVRGPVMASSLGGAFSLEEIEREHIARVVAQAPSFEATARILGIDSTTLQCKRKRYGLA